MLRKACKFRLCSFQSPTEFQITAIFLRQEVADRPLDDAIAMVCQAHILDHLGLQQADGVARDGIAETGVEFLGHRRAAYDIASLDDAYLHSGAGKIKGADKSVVASANDYSIIFLGHLWLQPGAG